MVRIAACALSLAAIAGNTASLGAAPKSPQATLITNVSIFDGRSEVLNRDQRVLVEDNLIRRIGRELEIPVGGRVIDGGSRKKNSS